MSYLICNVCEALDSHVSNGDCDACNECYSIEQGFKELTDWEHDNNLYVDEFGNLYDDNNTVVGVELTTHTF